MEHYIKDNKKSTRELLDHIVAVKLMRGVILGHLLPEGIGELRLELEKVNLLQ